MPVEYLFLLSLLAMSHCQFEYLDKRVGPYRFVIRQIEHCEDRGLQKVFIHETRISKVGKRNYVYSTNVTTLVPIDNSLKAQNDVAIMGNGGWRLHHMIFDVDDVCYSSKLYHPRTFNLAMEIVGIKDCPIPAGTYELVNTSLNDLEVLKGIPEFPYGKYRVDCKLLKDGVLLGCERMYFDALPPKRKHRKSLTHK